MADRFINCTLQATHRDSKELCCLGAYNLMGWCHMEMFSELHVSPNSDCLSELDTEDFNNLSLQIFEGAFTVRSDMEKLVELVLGLYSLVFTHGPDRKLQFSLEQVALSTTYTSQQASHRIQDPDTSALWKSS